MAAPHIEGEEPTRENHLRTEEAGEGNHERHPENDESMPSQKTELSLLPDSESLGATEFDKPASNEAAPENLATEASEAKENITPIGDERSPSSRARGGPSEAPRSTPERDSTVRGPQRDEHILGEHGASEPVNLFVRNVAKHVIEQQMIDLFSKYGKVDSAVVVRDPHSKECRGFGFVKMCTEEGAIEAISTFQDYEFEGRNISVERAKRSAPHSRTPGAYMGIDRRIRDRYVGMKRHRDYEPGRYPSHPPQYDMRGSGYRGRYHEPSRGRPNDRPWDHRMPYENPPFDDRERTRRRYNPDGQRYPPPRDFERDQRQREREPPVPRESAEDYI